MGIDYEKFIRSDYNTLINTVSSSRDSNLFKKINPNNSNILEVVQLNDGKYSDPVYLRSRYEGAKSTSAKYTFYTPGDTSYGKNASVDINTTKFTWSNNINVINQNFYDKCSISIKYLIDATGSVTELSSKNTNLFEIQNMYKKGDTANVSLMDKYNPTNQSNLDGDKYIYEGGFSFSPIIFREANEDLNFLYLEPKEVTTSRLGIKTVSVPQYVFRTIANADTTFYTVADDIKTIFTIDGVNTPDRFSKSEIPSRSWPYLKIPLNTTGPYTTWGGGVFYDSSPTVDAVSNYYTLDWFVPDVSGSVGYVTNDSLGNMKSVKTGGEWYEYFQATRFSKYVVSVDIPVKISYGSNPDGGPSTFKVLGVIEKQLSGQTSWEYVTNTSMRLDALPQPSGNIGSAIGVDTSNSSIFIDDNLFNSGYIQVSCQLNNYKIDLNTGDKIRLKVYFVEMKAFFRKTENIIFEISAGSTTRGYFEVWDEANSGIVPILGTTIPGTTKIFSVSSDNQTIDFDSTSSLLYSSSIFVAPSIQNPSSISNYYSPVESPFYIEVGDLIRFSSYYTINAEIFTVSEVTEPRISYAGSTPTVLSTLKVKLDKLVNSSKVNTRTFAILKRKKDETSVIINFKKTEGQTSNALIIPYNIDDDIRRDVSNIIAPLKNTILSNVLVF